MTPTRLLQTVVMAGALTLPVAASAQSYDPDPVTGGVCGLINFQFCPQPPVPVAPLPDPEGDAERAMHTAAPPPPNEAAYAPVRHRHVRRPHHRVHPSGE